MLPKTCNTLETNELYLKLAELSKTAHKKVSGYLQNNPPQKELTAIQQENFNSSQPFSYKEKGLLVERTLHFFMLTRKINIKFYNYNKVSLFLRERFRESSLKHYYPTIYKKDLMSFNNKTKLTEIAKTVCRELRKNSTNAERIFWENVRNKKFNGKKFYRQHPIYHDITGRETFFIADFFCHSEKLIIELDGKYHQYRLKEDNERTEILNQLGLRVVRFSNDEIINDLNNVLLKLKKQLSTELENSTFVKTL